MGTLQYGARQAVQNCVRLRPGENVVIITDQYTASVGRALEKEASQVSPGNISLFSMEDFGERPEDGSNPLRFPEAIQAAMQKANVSFYAAQGKAGEFKTFRKPMIELVEHSRTLRHAHMIGISEALMKDGMAVDYGKIQRVTEKVYALASKAKTMSVQTPAGTDLRITLSPKYKWYKCDGLIVKPGTWTNLPDGETFTTPASVEGTMVVDGVLGDYFDDKYGRLDAHPATIRIVDGYAKEVSCANGELRKELWGYLHSGRNSNRVGEVAIGTSVDLRELVGNLLQDEKFPGNHNAFGDPLGKHTGARWKSSTHIDGVMRNCTIALDGQTIMRDGKFIDEILRD